MSRIAERALWWIVENPYQAAIYGYAIRHAPVPTAKITLEIGKFGARVAPHVATLGRATAGIVVSHSPLLTNSAKAVRWGAPVAAGAMLGVAAGTAISTSVWGSEGNQLSRQFYSGTADNWYDYLPIYNVSKIVGHYVEH